MRTEEKHMAKFSAEILRRAEEARGELRNVDPVVWADTFKTPEISQEGAGISRAADGAYFTPTLEDGILALESEQRKSYRSYVIALEDVYRFVTDYGVKVSMEELQSALSARQNWNFIGKDEMGTWYGVGGANKSAVWFHTQGSDAPSVYSERTRREILDKIRRAQQFSGTFEEAFKMLCPRLKPHNARPLLSYLIGGRDNRIHASVNGNTIRIVQL
jgi:hypothetical protein